MPRQAEIVGTYALSRESSDFLAREKHYVSTPRSFIELRANGEVFVEGMPDCYVMDPPTKHSFLAGRGTWQIETTDFGYGVTLDIVAGGSLEPGIYHASSILLKGKVAPFKLQVGIGDPDNHESLLFMRGN